MHTFRIALAMLLFALAWTLPVFAEGPHLTADNPDFDFGEVLQGERLEHVFTFRNAGDRDLVISKVRSSCGCTAALLSAEVIPPGAVGEVRATFDSGKFRGAVEKKIYLTSNDPRQGSTALRLRGRVLPVLEAPAEVDLGPLPKGERREARIPLVNRGKGPIALTSVASTLPAVRVLKAPAALPAGKSGEVVLLVESAASEPVNGYLLIRTDSPRLPELRLPLFAR